MKRKLHPALLCRLIIDLDFSGETIDSMSRDEIFETILHNEGFINYGDWIKELVLQVYGIDLNNWPEYLDPQSVAEMKGLEEY